MHGRPLESGAERTPQNAFHFLRLLGALFVIISHSYALNGLLEQDWMWKLTNRAFTFSYVGLMLFFVISGYLITKSADTLGRASLAPAFIFIKKRALRIMPGFIAAVFFTVFVFGTSFTDLPLPAYLRDPITWSYFKTVLILPIQYRLPGVFGHNPLHAVNGSLWTIPYEVACYVGILMLSFLGFKRLRYAGLATFVVSAVLASTLPIRTNLPGLVVLHLDLFSLLRFGLYFAGGSLIYLFRDAFRWNTTLFVGALALLVLGITTGKGLLVSFFAMPYLILHLGHAKGPFSGLGKYGDYSYGMYLYAFPVQQALVSLLGTMPVWRLAVLATTCTFPLAYLSWKFVEEPALRWVRKERASLS